MNCLLASVDNQINRISTVSSRCLQCVLNAIIGRLAFIRVNINVVARQSVVVTSTSI